MRKFFMLISNLKMLLLRGFGYFVSTYTRLSMTILTYFCRDVLHFSSYQHRIGRRAILEPYFEVKKRVLYAGKYGFDGNRP